MVFFAVADFQVYPKYDFVGITLVCISVVADAFLPNFQERVFEHGSSRVEVTYFTNIICLAAMTVSFTATGEYIIPLTSSCYYAVATIRDLSFLPYPHTLIIKCLFVLMTWVWLPG